MSSKLRLPALLAAALVLPASDCDGNLGGVTPLRQLTVRVSVKSDESETVGGSDPRFSGDGRFVAFDSTAPDLVTGDSNGKRDVFVKDRLTGEVELVSVTANGLQFDSDAFVEDISGDGDFVVFRVPPAAGDPTRLYRRDRPARETRPVLPNAAMPNYDCQGAAISDDGLSVVFYSYSDNLGFTNSPQYFQVMLSDLSGNDAVLSLVSSTAANGAVGGNNYSSQPDVTADGTLVVFESNATNLQGVGTDGTYDVFLWTRSTGVLEVVSRTAAGVEADGTCTNPTISDDGRWVSFETTAPNLQPMRVALRDRQTPTTISAYDEAYLGGLVFSVSPTMSKNGRRVAWWTGVDVTGPGNGRSHVYVFDRPGGTTFRASINDLGELANLNCVQPALSGDGRWIAWSSFADNLVTEDNNAAVDIFVRGPYDP